MLASQMPGGWNKGDKLLLLSRPATTMKFKAPVTSTFQSFLILDLLQTDIWWMLHRYTSARAMSLRAIKHCTRAFQTQRIAGFVRLEDDLYYLYTNNVENVREKVWQECAAALMTIKKFRAIYSCRSISWSRNTLVSLNWGFCRKNRHCYSLTVHFSSP